MLINEFHRAEQLAAQTDEKSLAELHAKSGKTSEMVSWLGFVSLLMLTVGRYGLSRLVRGYAESGADLYVAVVAGLGFAATLALSQRVGRKREILELALTLKRRAAKAERSGAP